MPDPLTVLLAALAVAYLAFAALGVAHLVSLAAQKMRRHPSPWSEWRDLRRLHEGEDVDAGEPWRAE